MSKEPSNDRPPLDHDLDSCHICGAQATSWADGPMGTAVGVCAEHRVEDKASPPPRGVKAGKA